MSNYFLDYLKKSLYTKTDLQFRKEMFEKTASYFEMVLDTFDSGSPVEQKKAAQELKEIKHFLESKTYMMMEALRINEEEYQEILKNPFFSDQEQNTITQISENLRYEKYNKK